MKKDILNNLLWLTIMLVILFFTINHYRAKIKVLEDKVTYYKDIGQVHDTVYINKPFKVEIPYNQYVIPNSVKYYKPPTDSILPEHDTIYSFKLNHNTLEVALYKDSSYSKELYKLNLDKYQYLYSNNALTVKKNRLWRLRPYTELRVRPFNQMYDLSAGMIFKTTHFNYKLGANIFYYPRLRSKVGEDLEITISYNF